MYKIPFNYFLILLLLGDGVSYSQSFRIVGQVVNAKTQPVEFMDVYLTTSTASNMPHTYTDSLGNFTLQAERGSYTLTLAEFGKEKYSQVIALTQDLNLGQLTVDEGVVLDSITITAKKKLIERKVDRLVFNVENSVAASGGDALDALKVTPSVRIQGNEIKLAGKSSVRVLVNDKLVQINGDELQNYLKSIPIANIQKIEVITNPPAKYEAEGNSGLISIQLKEVKQNNWSATLRSSYQQATYENLSHGIGMSYKKNKFSVLTDVNYRYGRDLYINDINYYYPVEHWNNTVFNRSYRHILSTLLNVKYDLTEKSSIGVQFIGAFSDNYTDEYNNNYSYADNGLMKFFKTDGVSREKPKNVSINLNYDVKIGDKGKGVSIDVDYFNSLSPKDNNFTSILQNYIEHTNDKQSANNTSDQVLKNYSLKTDFDFPYTWVNISFGAKISSTKIDNMVSEIFYDDINSNPISSQRDYFRYAENTQSLYFSVSKSFGEKWETKLGVRAENTQTKANSISINQVDNNDYFKVFPTVYLSYKANDNHTLSVNFGRRIGRPGFGELNPARWYINSKSYATGNPFLQPSFVYNYEFNYAYKGFLNLNMTYADIKDISGQLTYHDILNESQLFKRLNYADGKYMGGTITISDSPFKWWESSIDLSISYGEFNPYVAIMAKRYSGWQGYIATNNILTLNQSKTFFVSTYYQYNSPSKVGYNTATSSSTLDVGFKYITLDKKLTIGVMFEDVFRKNFSIYQNFSSEILQNFKQYYDTRLFRFSLSYKFGNSKIVVNQRNIGNQEEKRRSK